MPFRSLPRWNLVVPGLNKQVIGRTGLHAHPREMERHPLLVAGEVHHHPFSTKRHQGYRLRPARSRGPGTTAQGRFFRPSNEGSDTRDQPANNPMAKSKDTDPEVLVLPLAPRSPLRPQLHLDGTAGRRSFTSLGCPTTGARRQRGVLTGVDDSLDPLEKVLQKGEIVIGERVRTEVHHFIANAANVMHRVNEYLPIGLPVQSHPV